MKAIARNMLTELAPHPFWKPTLVLRRDEERPPDVFDTPPGHTVALSSRTPSERRSIDVHARRQADRSSCPPSRFAPGDRGSADRHHLRHLLGRLALTVPAR